MDNIEKIFNNPGPQWRGKPFWSWNGDLKEEELLRQIQILKDMGFGGFFMHSRTGLATEYLGEKWFQLINRCAEEGEDLGMEAWIYDEDRWPSGTAGGMVTENPEYQMKFIHLDISNGRDFSLKDAEKQEGKWLGAWSCRLKNKFDIYDLKKVNKETSLKEIRNKKILSFRVVPMESSPFYNGATYVDTMKREATDEYIRLTHEAYKEHCGEHFGKAIKGVFTDEPHRGPFMSGFSLHHYKGGNPLFMVPWTDTLFEEFFKVFGYSVEENLPKLFLRYKGQKVSDIKAHYAEIMLKLFINNFAKPCYNWCEDNNLKLTGHVLHENNFSSQVSTNGSVQRYYPHMHIPGVDVLSEHTRDYWLVKQVDSTARQFGQKWILSELYGCTGWQMSFQQHKAMGAWQTLFGVNLRSHHLSWYSMQGESKRDFPASIFHQSPWYKEYDKVETWFSRLGYFRSLGNPICDLLVINPVESVWGRVYPGAIKVMDAQDRGIKKLEKKYSKLFHILAGNQIDFDYGDEGLLEEHGSVSGETSELKLGEMKYKTVLVAGMSTIRKSTLVLLRQFQKVGGRLVFAGDIPDYVDSKLSSEVEDLLFSGLQCEFREKEIVETLTSIIDRPCRILGSASGKREKQVFSQFRKDKDGEYLTVLNMNRKKTLSIDIELNRTTDAVEEWNLDDGQRYKEKTHISNGRLYIDTLKLAPSGALCFRLASSTDLPAKKDEFKATSHRSKLSGSCNYSLGEKNICVLDRPKWNLMDAGFSGPMEILQIDRLIRNNLNIPLRGGEMVQPWFRAKQSFESLGSLKLEYNLKITAGALQSMKTAELVLETPERFNLIVNGQSVDLKQDNGFWTDIAFRRIPLPEDIFVEGINHLELSCDFREDVNLEALYLIGDFAVDVSRRTLCINPLPKKVVPRNLVKQGFPFYSGSFFYHYDVPQNLQDSEVLITIPQYYGAYVKLHSGTHDKIVPWLPAETTFSIHKEIVVEVSITRKNTFGPLYNPLSNMGTVGPKSFITGWKWFYRKPTFIKSGLIRPIIIHRSK